MQGWWSWPSRLATWCPRPAAAAGPAGRVWLPAGRAAPRGCARPVRPVKAPITLAVLFRAGSSCCAAGQIIHLDEKAATGCVELHHGGRAGTALDPHRGRRSQQSRRQGPAAAFGSQRSGEPVLAAPRRAGAVSPARETALLAPRARGASPGLAGRAGVTRAVGPRALEGEMHGSPHPAGSERDEPVPGMICGGAPAPQAPPEMHDPALAAGRIWSPRRETARLAAFRSLAFPAGPWRYPAAGTAPPGAWRVARGPARRAQRPSRISRQHT